MTKSLLLSVLIFLACCSFKASADEMVSSSISVDPIENKQESDNLFSRNIFVEFGGPSIGIGVGYDQRFTPKSVFGFRAGLAFSNGSSSDNGWFGYEKDVYTDLDYKGVTIPLEANAILGKRASKFEVGIGATPCILNRHEIKLITTYNPDNEDYPFNYRYEEKEGTRLNIFGTINIGYRLQRKSGFFMRVGLTFLIGDLKCSPMEGVLFIPNLSLGYTIR